MSLSVEVHGTGPDLVLLHGWALHGGLFAPLVPALAAHRRVHVVDLPGHGRSRYRCGPGLRAWTAAVRDAVPDTAAWLGWSLGGLLALRHALDAPSRVLRLVLVAVSPCFVRRADWPHGQEPAVVAQLGDAVARDHCAAVRQFLSLQALGDAAARAQVRALRPLLFERGDPDPRALGDGLDLLADTDLRAELDALAMPTLVLHGARDRLVPPAAAAEFGARSPRAEVAFEPHAAHTPFLTDPAGFARRVAEFVDG